jgi:hypothetical protein
VVEGVSIIGEIVAGQGAVLQLGDRSETLAMDSGFCHF